MDEFLLNIGLKRLFQKNAFIISEIIYTYRKIWPQGFWYLCRKDYLEWTYFAEPSPVNNVNWLKIHRKMKALTITNSTNAIKHVRKEFNPFNDDISSFSNVENITRACEPEY